MTAYRECCECHFRLEACVTSCNIFYWLQVLEEQVQENKRQVENARKALEKALQTVKAQAAQIEELSKQVRFHQTL